jgi:hypothetical protein
MNLTFNGIASVASFCIPRDDGSWVWSAHQAKSDKEGIFAKSSILLSASCRCWLLRFHTVCWQDGMQMGVFVAFDEADYLHCFL